MTASLARAVSLVYLALVVVLAVFAARRAGRRTRIALLLLVWLALISLGAFQAPFIPGNYGALSVIWLLLVLAAGVRRAVAAGAAGAAVGPVLAAAGFLPRARRCSSTGCCSSWC